MNVTHGWGTLTDNTRPSSSTSPLEAHTSLWTPSVESWYFFHVPGSNVRQTAAWSLIHRTRYMLRHDLRLVHEPHGLCVTVQPHNLTVQVRGDWSKSDRGQECGWFISINAAQAPSALLYTAAFQAFKIRRYQNIINSLHGDKEYSRVNVSGHSNLRACLVSLVCARYSLQYNNAE